MMYINPAQFIIKKKLNRRRIDRPDARIARLGGGRNKFCGHEKFFYVNSRGAREHEKFISVWIK